MLNFGKLTLDDSSALKEVGSKNNFLVAVGTQEGKVVVYRVGQLSHQKLLSSKNGISFGAISDVDLSNAGEHMVVTNQSGEILQFDLLAKLNEQ